MAEITRGLSKQQIEFVDQKIEEWEGELYRQVGRTLVSFIENGKDNLEINRPYLTTVVRDLAVLRAFQIGIWGGAKPATTGSIVSLPKLVNKIQGVGDILVIKEPTGIKE